MHLIDQLPQPLVFAHRGASKYAPENTMAAFHLAQKQGAPAIELDTMLTADGVPVVIHDDTIDRTTAGSGRVGEMNLKEIRAYDAGAYFSADFTGEHIPTLQEVLETFKGEMLVNIELKNYHSPFDKLPERVAELIAGMHYLDAVLFSSFQPLNLIRIKRLLPGAKVALLVEEGFWWRRLASGFFSFLSPEFIHPYKSYIQKNYLDREHALGRRVNVWTVDDPAEAASFMDWGIDGLITNDPPAMLGLSPHSH